MNPNFLQQLTEIERDFESIEMALAPRIMLEAFEQSVVSRAANAVQKISGPNSSYSKDIARVIALYPTVPGHLSAVHGVVKALKADLEAGYWSSLLEIVHGEVFSDYLDMADHLLESGYKDAAAVIAGSTLEGHLKKLATKNSIPTEVGGNPSKSEKINTDLTRASVYEMNDQKAVTAWLGIRNSAAHGDYSKYSKDQVKLMILRFARLRLMRDTVPLLPWRPCPFSWA